MENLEKENFKLIFHFKFCINNEEENKKFEEEVTEKIKEFHKESLIIMGADLEIHIIQN